MITDVLYYNANKKTMKRCPASFKSGRSGNIFPFACSSFSWSFLKMLTENGGSLLILSSGKEEQISSDLLKKSLQILLWEGSRRWEFEGPMKTITKCITTLFWDLHYYLRMLNVQEMLITRQHHLVLVVVGVCEHLRPSFCGWLLWAVHFTLNKGKQSPQELYLCVIHIRGLEHLGKNATKKSNFPCGLHDLHKLNLSLLRQIGQAHLMIVHPQP